MNADDPYRREYRYAGDSWLWVALATPFLGGVGLVVGLALTGVPIAVPVAVGAALAALFLFVARLVVVPATISDQTHMTVQGVSLFQHDAASRSCKVWMALAILPVRKGQQRS
ncbi:hypothetical protein ACFY4C_40075, partial [Actinomadura viridis]|uniref:hypothetical protein n=1 Tax=Actinomadura viridis TaxID=58110 RepID=UPI0036844280